MGSFVLLRRDTVNAYTRDAWMASTGPNVKNVFNLQNTVRESFLIDNFHLRLVNSSNVVATRKSLMAHLPLTSPTQISRKTFAQMTDPNAHQN